MVSVLDSQSSGPGLSLSRSTVLCSWAGQFTFIVPLSTQAYKWVLVNLLTAGGSPAMDQHPIQGVVEISVRNQEKIQVVLMANAGQSQATGPLFFLKTGCPNEVLVVSGNRATTNFEH